MKIEIKDLTTISCYQLNIIKFSAEEISTIKGGQIPNPVAWELYRLKKDLEKSSVVTPKTVVTPSPSIPTTNSNSIFPSNMMQYNLGQSPSSLIPQPSLNRNRLYLGN